MHPQHLDEAVEGLKRSDPKLAVVIDAVGPCLLIKQRRPRGFVTLVQAIVSQSLSAKAATTILDRLYRLLDDGALTPVSVLALDDSQLRAIGLSTNKCRFIKDLARRVDSGELHFGRLSRMDDARVIQTLTKINGIGRWTAEMYLIFAMNRLDVFPFDDVSIVNAIKTLYAIDHPDWKNDIETISSRWKPYRSIACWYLYAWVDGKRG